MRPRRRSASSTDGRRDTVDCRLTAEPAVNTRRKISFNSVARWRAHSHHSGSTAGHFYFDFLEAVVPTDVPEPLPARTNVSPALDYSTDHTYKLSPGRSALDLRQPRLRGSHERIPRRVLVEPAKASGRRRSYSHGHLQRRLRARRSGIRRNRWTTMRQDRFPRRYSRHHRPPFRILHQRKLRRRLGPRGG